jgi:hypothetical protein
MSFTVKGKHTILEVVRLDMTRDISAAAIADCVKRTDSWPKRSSLSSSVSRVIGFQLRLHLELDEVFTVSQPSFT